MDRHKYMQEEHENVYDGAINQITPAPEKFTPKGVIDLENKEQIIVRTKPQRSQKLACLIYFCIQLVIFCGIMANYSLFNSFVDAILWIITLITFISYLRVCFSNPGYIEGNVIMTEEANENDLKEFENFTNSNKEENKGGHGKQCIDNIIERKRSVKTSVLVKGFAKHSRYVKSSTNLKEHARHVRTSSVGNNIMTLSNKESVHRGYSKLHDQTFKSGDFSKIKTEMDEADLFETIPNETKGHHRRKTSTIKKIGTVQLLNMFDQEQK